MLSKNDLTKNANRKKSKFKTSWFFSSSIVASKPQLRNSNDHSSSIKNFIENYDDSSDEEEVTKV